MVDENKSRTGEQEARTSEHSLTALKARQADLKGHRDMYSRQYSVIAGFSLFGLVAAPVCIWLFNSQIHRSPVLAFLLLYFLSPAAVLPTLRTRLRDLDNDLQQIDFQIDLFSFDVSKREIRAEQLLHLNHLQLRRYIDLNLSQNSWIFTLGVACILLGTVILASTLYVLLRLGGTEDSTTKIITAVLGGVGAFLTNFVAAVYLKMSATANQNLASFYSRLAENQQLMLGNLLASRIDDDAKRWDTLAALSLRLVPLKEDHSAAGG
jgi:hypothetical protein